MAEPTVTTNIPAPAGPVADNGEDVSPEAAKSAGNNSSRGAAVLRRFVEDLEKSKEGAKEVGMFREWIQPMLDDDDFEEGLDMRDSRGKTLLHIAAIEGLAETAKRLIDAGAVLDALDERGDTPLIDACGEGDGEDGHIEVVKLLLKKGARAGIFGNEHESPLYRAVINGHHRIVQYLLSQVEWDLDVGEEIYNITPLHAAASAEDGEMVRYLRDKGARLDLRDTDGWTPLMTAIASRKEKAMEELLRRRNDEDLQLETEDSEGRSPILRAAKDGFMTGLRLLMEAGANVNVRDRDKRQPLHLACTGDEENGQYNEVIQLLLDQNPRPYTETVMKEMENAVELAFEYDHNERAEAILDILAEASPWVSHTLLWAAGETKRHKIALSLLKRQLKGSPPPDAESSEGWTAIEWATYARELPALWLLIASSPQNKQTKDILKSVQVIAKKYKLPNSEKQKRGQAEDPKKRGKGGKISLDIQDILDDPPTGLICTDDQTYDPPDHTGQHFPSMEIYKAAIVRFYKERGQFGRIVRFRALEDTIYQQGPGKIMSEVLEKFEENLRGVEKGIAKNMRRSIFMDLEPKFTWIHLPATNMMWMNHLVQRIMKDEDQSGSHFNQAKSFFKDSWIEVPDKVSASRIMRPRFVSRDAISRDTTDDRAKMKDKDNVSMGKSSGGEGDGVDEGGRESARGGYGADGNESGEQKQKKTQDEEATAASSVASTAIYMPFLSYSFECAERTETFCPVDGQTEKGPGASENPILSHNSQKDPELGHKGPEHQKKSEQTNDVKHEGEIQQGKESEYAKAFQDARKRYQELLDEYNNNMNGNIIHGSSTLDESYYHFGEDLESTEDRNRRNGTQVATESWLEQRERNKKQLKENNQENVGKKPAQTQEGLKDDEQANEQNDHSAERKQRLGPYWLLIRVNQLWIWTINDKWLISASSHPIDGSENELFQGILDRLERQGEAGGSDLQPGSTAEMSQLIIDYCVDSYERKPKAHDDERPEECKLGNFPSIRQTFSKSINSIARDETKLFEDFSKLTMELRKRSNDDAKDYSKAVSIIDNQLADATIKAEVLSSRVKDILDELSILEATVQYQQDVQRAMKKHDAQRAMVKQDVQKAMKKQNVLETELTATYIINDIKGLGSVAERVHAAVNTTLSLQQSEIANLQARLSIQHAELATRQGRVLMVFTVVTILFLPLSFLTSLFALDVASFLQAPPWALGVIFSVSFGLFVPMVIAAFTWKRSKEFVREKITKLRDHPMFQPRGDSVDRLQPSIRDQSGTPNQTHSNEGNHGPELGHSEASHQAEPQATNSSTHSSRARKRSDRSTPGDEEMALGFR